MQSWKSTKNKKIKNFLERRYDIVNLSPKKFEKNFQEGIQSFLTCVLGEGYTYTLTQFTGLSFSAVGITLQKIPLFAILRYFLRLYRCFWYNDTFKGYKALK